MVLERAILEKLMPELSSAMADRFEEVVGEAGKEFLAGALDRYLEERGGEILAPVVELERMKRKKLLSPREVCALYGIKVRTLDDWRLKKVGPPYRKMGGKVMYDPAEMDAFCLSSRILTSSGPRRRSGR